MSPEQLQRLENLERMMQEHHHSGLGDVRVNLQDVFGKFKVVSVAPVAKPNSLFEQIQIYTNSTTYRLYWYDYTAGTWHYVTASA